MTDDDVLRLRLQRMAAYRQVRAAVRAGATHTLVNAALMLGLAYFFYSQFGFHPILVIQAGFGLAELAVGLWKKARPSAECVLMDGLVAAGFALSSLGRQALAWQGVIPGGVHPIGLFIGVWLLLDAIRAFRTYGELRRAFPERPTADQLAWFDDLVYEVRAADPAADPSALDLPTDPPWKGKLLGDTAFLAAARGEEVLVAGPESIDLDVGPEGRGGRRRAALRVYGHEFPEFVIDPASAANYERWRAEYPV